MPKLHCQQSCLTQPLESTSSLAGIFHEVLPVCLSAEHSLGEWGEAEGRGVGSGGVWDTILGAGTGSSVRWG